MRIETIKNIQPTPDSTSGLKMTNQIQTALINESKEDPMAWIEENAAHFREIIDANPQILEQYQKNPDLFMRDMREKLKQMRTIH